MHSRSKKCPDGIEAEVSFFSCIDIYLYFILLSLCRLFRLKFLMFMEVLQV